MAIGEDDRARRNQVAVVVAIRAGNHSCGVGDLNAALGRMVLDSDWWRSVIASIGGIRKRNMQCPRAAKPVQNQFLPVSGTRVYAKYRDFVHMACTPWLDHRATKLLASSRQGNETLGLG